VRQIKEWQAQRLSLNEIRQRLIALDAADTPQELSAQFLERALAGEVAAARRTILSARDTGMSMDDLFLAVLRPALLNLGDRWEHGIASVAQEKEVSEIARDLIADLSLHASRSADSSAATVAACVAGERHELGLRMLSGLLAARGAAIHFLGADVALPFLVDAVERRDAHTVLLSVTGDAYLPILQETAQALRNTRTAPAVFVGGQAIDRHWDHVARWDVAPISMDDLNLDAFAERLRLGRTG
jgi:methanogenic corrinoid protein MtbC1